MKIVDDKNVPDIPELTKEDVKRLIDEGNRLADILRKRIDKMQNLTAEDWAFRCK